MSQNKASDGKLTLLFLSALSSIFLFFLFTSSASYAAEIKEIENRISISETNIGYIETKIKNIWKEFERSSVQRGMLIKTNYQPFVPALSRVTVLDTPLGELARRGCRLSVETELTDGKDADISALTLSKISDGKFSDSSIEQQIGYADGKLGKNITYWREQERIITEELKASDQFKLENFKRSTELEYAGNPDSDDRRVPLEDVFHFFPEFFPEKNEDLKLNFDHLYPQSDVPMFKAVYEPGRIHFGSLIHSDVKITFLHNIITKQMVHGEISWKVTFGEFTTGEELGLCESFFDFIQENLAKAGLIAPASVIPF